MDIVELPAHAIVQSIQSPAFYTTPPIIHQRHLMPYDVLPISDRVWYAGRFPGRLVNFYRVRDAIIAEAGLVFDAQRNLLLPTKRNHTLDQVAKVHQSVACGDELRSLRVNCGVLCKQPGGQNYGHWLAEMLPKAFFASRELGRNGLQFLVPHCADPMRSIIFESMEMIGIPQSQIVAIGPDPVRVDDLILIEGLTYHGGYMSPLVFECLEQLSCQVSGARHGRVYVTREPSVSREFEDAAMIEQALAQKGFTKIRTFGRSLREQIAAFKDATCVFGTMGAAMTNIAFCRPGIEVFVFAPASAAETFFWFLAQHKKLRYNEVRCEEIGPSIGPLPWNRKLRVSAAGIQVYRDAAENQLAGVLLCDPETAKSNPPVRLTPECLIGRDWRYYHEGKPPLTERLRFLPGGQVGGYEHPNETWWAIEEGILSFFDSTGWRSTKFEDGFLRGGRLLLRGRFRGNLNHPIVLCLEEG